MRKLKTSVITVVGINSGVELQIDLKVLAEMLQAYIKDAPREERTLNKVLEMVRFHDKVSDLLNAEFDAANEKIKEEMSQIEVKGAEIQQAGTPIFGDELNDLFGK